MTVGAETLGEHTTHYPLKCNYPGSSGLHWPAGAEGLLATPGQESADEQPQSQFHVSKLTSFQTVKMRLYKYTDHFI